MSILWYIVTIVKIKKNVVNASKKNPFATFIPSPNLQARLVKPQKHKRRKYIPHAKVIVLASRKDSLNNKSTYNSPTQLRNNVTYET